MMNHSTPSKRQRQLISQAGSLDITTDGILDVDITFRLESRWSRPGCRVRWVVCWF